MKALRQKSLSIPFGKPLLDFEEREAVMKVLGSPTLVHGPQVKQFEESFARFTGAQHAVALSSCTAGMHLYYHILGIGPGDEVIVPALTHTATAHAVEFCGATTVFADVEKETGNIDPKKIAQAITPKTKAISVVHYLGLPVDMGAVNALAKEYELKVLEDCALAIGTKLDGVHAGLHSEGGCFSFYPVKHMTTAEGGMFITNSKELADQVRHLRAFGVDRQVGERKVPGLYDVTGLGFNYRMNEIQSALGIEQLKKMPEFLNQRQENYALLYKELEQVPGIRLLRRPDKGEIHSHYCLVIVLENDIATQRENFINQLKEHGIGSSVYYPGPVPAMTYYREKYGEKNYPVAEEFSSSSVALPVGPHINLEEMKAMAHIVEDVLRGL